MEFHVYPSEHVLRAGSNSFLAIVHFVDLFVFTLSQIHIWLAYSQINQLKINQPTKLKDIHNISDIRVYFCSIKVKNYLKYTFLS